MDAPPTWSRCPPSPSRRRQRSSPVSSSICGRLRPWQEVQVSGPNGKRFLLPVDRAAHDYLFLATGTGIAPFRGMIADLLGKVDRDVTLIMGAPYETDLLYHEHFLGLAASHERFNYLTAISRESVGGRPKEYTDGALLGAIGGIPVRRDKRNDLVEQMAQLLRSGQPMARIPAAAASSRVCGSSLIVGGALSRRPAISSRMKGDQMIIAV